MNTLKNKIDFVVLVSVTRANSNGDPLNGNQPRTDYDGFGEISDVCIKRKIRNRMQDLGQEIFVQSEDRKTDKYTSLQSRANESLKGIKDKGEYARTACEKWLDVRSFGQVFAFSGDNKNDGEGISVGVRGPVSIHTALSISPIDIETIQITKSVNGSDTKDGGRAKDTMGSKSIVRFGLYEIKGAVNVQLAEKTGFSEEDSETIKECLRTLFINDASAARPEGSMEVVKLYWFKHNCKDGQYSSAKVHRSIQVSLNNPEKTPESVDDYNIVLNTLEGLSVEEIDGV